MLLLFQLLMLLSQNLWLRLRVGRVAEPGAAAAAVAAAVAGVAVKRQVAQAD